MPFKKGITPQGAKPFVKGQSGNPKGKPRKLATQLKINGYKKGEVSATIEAILAMTLSELKDLYENPNATILEKTVANALKKSLEKGSLYSIDSLLDRTHGKAKEESEINGVQQIEVIYAKKTNNTSAASQESTEDN